MSGVAWKPLGASGTPYPQWLRALRDKSGVYAIRETGIFGPTVVYVGESHSGNLKKTLTRHFQGWSRQKTFWESLFGGSPGDPGRTYSRSGVQVAVWVVPGSEAVQMQFEKIAALKPRDNSVTGTSVITLEKQDDDPFG